MAVFVPGKAKTKLWCVKDFLLFCAQFALKKKHHGEISKIIFTVFSVGDSFAFGPYGLFYFFLHIFLYHQEVFTHIPLWSATCSEASVSVGHIIPSTVTLADTGKTREDRDRNQFHRQRLSVKSCRSEGPSGIEVPAGACVPSWLQTCLHLAIVQCFNGNAGSLLADRP